MSSGEKGAINMKFIEKTAQYLIVLAKFALSGVALVEGTRSIIGRK